MVPRFVGSIIGIRPEFAERYQILRRNVFPASWTRISRSNIRNYSIFLRDEVLLGHFDYVGDDYAADMRSIAANSRIREWCQLTRPMQYPLPECAEDEWWACFRSCVPRARRRRIRIP